MKLRYAGNSHVGMKRSENEDSFGLLPEENLYIVADGMGGHASGEVASKMCIDTMGQFFKDTAADDEITWPFKMDRQKVYEENRIVTSVKLANLRIYESALTNSKHRGMGTTCVAALFTKDGVYLAWVGDSRIYRMRDNEYTQMTLDHSLLNDYIKMKQLTEEEIENFPHKNVITRALGMKETVQVDCNFDVPQHKDIYLLCSDGLNGMITDDEMADILRETKEDLETGCNKMIALANEHGGTDNISVVLCEYLDE